MQANGFAAALRAELSPDEIGQVLEVFATDLTRLGAALAAQARAGDGAGFRRSCHTLAGACGTVDATTLERLCRAAMASPEPPAALLAGIVEGIAGARREMAVFLAGRPG